MAGMASSAPGRRVAALACVLLFGVGAGRAAAQDEEAAPRSQGQVLLERLAKKPCARAELEKTIADALDGHLCRCTGYVKYHEAVRDVVLADPKRYLIAQAGQ